MTKEIILVLILISSLFACDSQSKFEVKDFNPMTNFKSLSDTVFIDLDLTTAAISGITIPSSSISNGYFKIKFEIKNKSSSQNQYYYKVYYQNESYKFNEYIKDSESKHNPRAAENFYGSWEVCEEGFHKTVTIINDNKYWLIEDSIRIVGNPRDEKKYYGSAPINEPISIADVEQVKERIINSDEWMKSIRSKSKKNNVSYEEQLQMDAIWIISHDRRKGNINNRWKRNPRVGNYSFLLVVVEKNKLKKIPEYIRNIGIKNSLTGYYINPFSYFKSTARKGELVIIESDRLLNTKAKLSVSQGVFINRESFITEFTDSSYINNYCGYSKELFTKAHFEQVFKKPNNNSSFNNIPLIYDVVDGNYTKKQYNSNASRYNTDSLIVSYIGMDEVPGKAVGYDSFENAIFIKNLGNNGKNILEKKNVGVKTRIGFTYGKYIAKIRFPNLLSNDEVWNGVTCAFWLLYQSNDKWNSRGICHKSGYIPKSEIGKSDIRLDSINYSEIDIEIIKTSKYWPIHYYPKEKKCFIDSALNNNLIIACTNWDLACKSPEKFNKGVQFFKHNDNNYQANRWSEWYKALTIKSEYPHDSTVGSVIYYEIDWQPEKIIWRIGFCKDNMIEIGYMDSDNTKIPDNQMIALVSQEFHLADWWPGTPYRQDFIPFPRKDIIGYIYEIEIE